MKNSHVVCTALVRAVVIMVLVSLSGANPVEAQVSKNPLVGPVNVTDLDNPARSPFQALLCGSFPSGGNLLDCQGRPSVINVPSDRRLVIEYLSAHCVLLGGITGVSVALETVVGGVNAAYDVHLSYTPFGTSTVEGSHLTRIYADPGTVAFMAFGSGQNGQTPGNSQCLLAVSGYTVTR